MKSHEKQQIESISHQNQGPDQKLEEFKSYLDEINWAYHTNGGRVFFDKWGTRNPHDPPSSVEYNKKGKFLARDRHEEAYGTTPKEAAEKLRDLEYIDKP